MLVACWMKRGRQKRIPTPGQQQWHHIFGAYHWATDQLVYLITAERNSEAFIAFLEHLVHLYATGRPLVIVLDNGSIHRSQATQATFALLENQLLPLFLPKYCSELNPIERFWKHLKASACSNKLFPNMESPAWLCGATLAATERLSIHFSFYVFKELSVTYLICAMFMSITIAGCTDDAQEVSVTDSSESEVFVPFTPTPSSSYSIAEIVATTSPSQPTMTLTSTVTSTLTHATTSESSQLLEPVVIAARIFPHSWSPDSQYLAVQGILTPGQREPISRR